MVTAMTEERERLAALATEDDMAVRTALDLSYGALPAGAARLYRLTGLFPGARFTSDLAAAAAAVPRGEAERLLGTLTGASLLEDEDPAMGTSPTVDFACREAARERPGFTQHERATSPGGPPCPYRLAQLHLCRGPRLRQAHRLRRRRGRDIDVRARRSPSSPPPLAALTGDSHPLATTGGGNHVTAIRSWPLLIHGTSRSGRKRPGRTLPTA
jgi:hypothetical protein